MGQAMTSETLSISGGDGHRYWVGLQAKPSSRGRKKTVYKGILLGSGPRQWEKVVAKSFTDMPGTRESWGYEVNKATLTKEMAARFAESYPSGYTIQVIVPGVVQMDKVSKVNRWLERRNGYRSLDKDDWISVEEYIPGPVYRFCPWSEEDDTLESDHLQTFSHFTYKLSNGELVACDFQGISEDNRYTFTDSVIHSRLQTYGRFDEGEHGIAEFFKHHTCSKLCSEWQVPMPLTPPPPFDDACGNEKRVRFDLTPFENVVFPSERLQSKSQKTSGSFWKRHRSFHHIPRKRQNSLESAERLLPHPASAQDKIGEGVYLQQRGRTLSEGAETLQECLIVSEGTHRKGLPLPRNNIPLPARKRSCLKRSLSDQRGLKATLLTPLPMSKPAGTRDAGFQPASDLLETGAGRGPSNKLADFRLPDVASPDFANTGNNESAGTPTPHRESSVMASDSHQSVHSGRLVGLLERRLSRDRGNDAPECSTFCSTLNAMALDVPRLKPTAPFLSEED